MLTPTAIANILKGYFTPFVRKKGNELFESNAVELTKFDDFHINALVSDDYEHFDVALFFDFEENSWDAVCDCGIDSSEYFVDCRHVAAACYKLIDFLAYGNRIGKRGSRPKKKVQRLKHQTKKLEHNKVDEYRVLPISNDKFGQALKEYAPEHYPELSWSESITGEFLTNTELELDLAFNYSYRDISPKKIRIKKEDDKLLVKCLSCSEKSYGLCTHQATILDAAEGMIMGFIIDHIEFYDYLAKQVVKKTGVKKNAVEKYYRILITETGATVTPISENTVGKEWLSESQRLITKKKEERKELISAQTKRLEDTRQRKYAFFWGSGINYHHSDSNEFHLYFVHGEGLKTKEGLQASSRKVNTLPTDFSKERKEIGQKLFFAMQEEDIAIRFNSVKSLIEDHREVLNSFYQYTYDGNIQYQNVRASELNLVTFHDGQLECRFEVERTDGLVHLHRYITLNEEDFDYKDIRHSNPVFCSTKDTAYCYSNEHFHRFMKLFGEHSTLVIPFTNKKEYTQLINGLQQYFDLVVDPKLIIKEEVLQNPLYQILLREVGSFVLFEPRLKYGEYSFNAFDEESYHIEKKVFKAADEDRKFLIDFLKNSHPEFDNEIQVQDYTFLDVNKLLSNYWFIHFNEACEAAGIEVLGQKELSKFNYSKHKAQTFSHVKSGIDWFDVEMGVSFGEEQIKTADWIKALRNKESFVKLKDGSLGVLPEEWLKQAQKILAVADVEKGNLRISKYRFNIIDDLFENIDDKKIVKELKDKKKRLENLELNKKFKVPKLLKAKLRTYQKHGFTWLKFLDESGFGGILADDMGLGKTVQVIALLADQIKEKPSIVVVPRSLLFNWAAELDKFCSDLTYVVHHGPGRAKLMEEILPVNVIITTYGTAASDIEMFKDFEFNYIILDESQAIKNADSKRYKAMRLLKSKNKLAMTGTPIENNTFDLYAQLSFTSPGLLGTKTSFKNNFAIPIDNKGDVEAANLLRKLIHPFLLRRTKDQVAKDLPPKTESVLYCEMGTTQRKLYTKLKKKIKEDIEEAVEEKGVNKSKFQMLDGLLRLRQMCNSPLLVNKSFTGKNAESVKIDILLEHLLENIENHNALVFSQFVSLLTIVRKELDKRGIPYAYLDGSTRKRQEEVDKFMKNEEVKIFLISIKAGNTGMNLTKADYVYILDPWWNPAVEAQAIDRTHRIGQDKQIFAYKLICKDSIEEKILKLQQKKKKLATDIIRTDENVLKSLTKTELMSLFD